MNQVAEDLQAAYDTLESRGWCQGAFSSREGEVCLDGALRLAVTEGNMLALDSYNWDISYFDGSSKRYGDAADILTSVIKKEFGNVYDIIDFNDVEYRSVEDVKLVLKKAISLGEE